MRNIALSVALCLTFSPSIAHGEDNSSLSVEMPRNAKVGHTEMHMEFERLPDGDTWESVVTCVKVSNRITKCVSTDELGWAETIICKGAKCQIVASR